MHRFDLEHAERAEALAVEVGDDLLLAFTRSVRAVGLWWSGDTDASLRSSRDAAERFASAGRRLEWSEAWKFHGVALVASGDANRGVAVQREALDAARSVVGPAFPTAHGLAYLGHTHRMLGDDDAALACWAEALDICRRIGNRGTAIHIAIGLADLFAERGTVDRALEHLGIALELIDASRAETYITWAWTVTVRAHATTGDTTEAIASARRALAAAHRVPPGEGRRLAIELADLALGLDDASTAARLLGVVDATPDVREMPFPPHSEAARVDALGRAVAARGGEDQRAAGRRRSLAEAAGALLVERAPRRDDDVTRRT